MTEGEVRERLRAAIGETAYPAALSSALRARLAERAADRQPRAMGLVTAALTLAILAALLGARLLTHPAASVAPRPVPAATSTPVPRPTPEPVPAEDLAAAHLEQRPNLVTALDLPATDGGRTISLLGGYADAARIVLFFRVGTDAGFPQASIDDDQGFINASSNGQRGLAGDYSYQLNTGPHADAQGVAHLTIRVDSLLPAFPATGPPTRGSWTWAIDLPVLAATQLAAPGSLPWGAWSIDLQALESTPSVVHLQAVLNGPSPEQARLYKVELLDAAGNPLATIAQSVSVTVPKQQLNAANYQHSLVDYQWQRPPAGGHLVLRLTGPTATRVIPLDLAPLA